MHSLLLSLGADSNIIAKTSLSSEVYVALVKNTNWQESPPGLRSRQVWILWVIYNRGAIHLQLTPVSIKVSHK